MSRSQPQPPVPQNRPKSPTKGPKPKHFITFQTGLDVKKALSVSDITQLVTNLNAVRSQLTVFRNEASLLASDDPKFLLAKGYLEESPSATELFTAWDTLAKQSIVHLHLALGVLAALLTLLSIHQPYHVLGVPILRALLAPQAGRRLNAHLNSAQTDLVLVALKLWNAMSDYGAGMEKKSVYEAFAWTNKSLFRLFHMRRKGSNDMTIDPFIKPDIRTLYITFVSGFLGTSSPPAVKIAFLEAHRDMFFGIFKRISDDHYLLIRFVLEGCWEGIWSDNRVKRTLKVGLFGDEVLTQLVKLYTRNVSEMPGEESIPADLVHHFFLALCTRPGIGVCFRDGGWYPREEDEGAIDEYSTNDNKPRGSRKLYNPILGRFLKHLRPTEDARQQVLIIRMFQSCTELVGGYWTSSGLAMEPRLSSRWLISTAWATSVISLPVPVHTFTTGNTGWGIDYNSDPPPLSSALGNIIPPVWSRAMITKGLQNVSQLVQYHTATCLTRCLQKYNAVRKSYKTVALALEEESSGNWTTRINELETEVKRRIPTFEVIVGFVQQKCISPELSSQDSAHLSDQSLRSLMIAGSALRLMLLYHKVLPDLPADARYDVGKLLLTGIGKRVLSFSTASDISPEDTVGFKVLCHLHILDLLQHSEQYIWNATLGQSSLRHLLCIYDPTDRSGASERCGALLHKILAQSALFEHDPGELDIWLGALRAANTGLHIDADEDAKIDENTLDFYSLLDGCIRNCLKSPLEYVELSISTLKSATEMSAGIADTVEIYDASSIASPLLMALLKEFETLTKGENDSRLLMALAVVTYLRQVVFGISLKQPNNHYGLRIATRLEYHCSSSNAGSLPQPVLVAIQKEIRLLRNLLHLVEAPSQTIEMQDHEGMVNFRIVIQRIEERFGASTTAAYELIRWFHLNNEHVSPDVLSHSLQKLEEWGPGLIPTLVLLVDPVVTPVFTTLQLSGHLNAISFPQAMIHTRPCDLMDEAVRKDLASLTINSTAYEAQIYGNLLLKRLSAIVSLQDESVASLLRLWAIIVSLTDPAEVKSVYQRLILGSPTMQKVLETEAPHPALAKGIMELISTLFDHRSGRERALAEEWCFYWTKRLSLSGEASNIIDAVRPWIPLMAHEELIAVFEYLIGTLKYTASPSYLLEDVFSVLETRPEIIDDPKVALYLPKLISLQPSLSISSSLYRVLREQVNASLPSGLKPINLHGNASEFVQKIEMQWRRHTRKPSTEVLRVIMPLLELDDSEILDLASQAMFQSSAVRDMVAHWLIAQTNLNHSTHFALEVLMETSSENTLYMREIGQRLGPLCTTLAMSTSTSNPQRESYQSTFFKLLPLVEEGHILVKRVVGLFSKRPTANVIPFLARLAQTGRVAQNDVEKILLLSIKELVSLLNEPLKSKEVIQAIPHLATFGNVSAESLDALFNISIRNHLTDSSVMTALSLLFHKISLKPAGCNRLIQAILHHSQFSTAASPNSTSREPLVDILYCLFKMHPQNTCQPSHITPLIHVYRGSLSVPDLSLLEIFRLFEQQRKYSVASLMASWGPDPGVVSTDILNAIIGLNSNLLFATCVEFPQWRTTQKSYTAEAHRSKSSLYDPFFILLLLHSYLSTQGGGRTLTPLDWVGFFRTNIASLVISSLSARHGDIRGLGWTAFGGLCNAVAQAEFYEKAQTFYIFKMLSRLHKATPANESPTENPRLSTYTTLFFAHAIRAVYTPASSLYPLVSRFLLQRPEFDLNDPPMLYSMLYSSLSSDFGKRGGNWKRERVWMLRFLADGMVSSQDWKVLQRRHTWDLLATTYHTHSNDGAIKQGVLKVLLRMTQNQRVATSLVCHSHLLSWASFTISGMSRIEDENTVMSWCQALENIVVFVDHERVTKRMGNLWHTQLLLCVNKLLNYITGNATTYSMDQSLEGLCTLTRIIQRFSSLPDTPVERETLFKAIGALKSVETGLDISLGEASQWSPLVSKWGEIQERLWLAMMSMDNEQKYDLWGILTARMVGLGSVKPPVLSEGTSAWVRIEVLHLLSQSDSFKKMS